LVVATEASGNPSSFPATIDAIRDGGAYVSVDSETRPWRWTHANTSTGVGLVEEGRLDLGA
jgi:hypothetical protein